MKPVIAIVGRPNVGKSTLFNRLARQKKAIVEDVDGVTRDRNYAAASFEERYFILIDTGGFEPEAKEGLRQQVREQVELAIQEADVILFLLDGRQGLTAADLEVADYLRGIAKPVFTVINKVDGERQDKEIVEFYRLGVEPLYAISAEHGRGINDLMEEVIRALPPSPEAAEELAAEIRVALVGRPNVGKSSLLNKLLGQPRAIVDASPGTTRDALDTSLEKAGRRYLFIDTAGIRRKSKIAERLEKYSVIRALKSLDRCDVALILLDGFEGLTQQDARIIELTEEIGRAMILVVNKWDLVKKDSATYQLYQDRIHRELKTLDYVPILFLSALTGQRVDKIYQVIEQVMAEYRKRIATSELNLWLKKTVESNPPPSYRNRTVQLYYISQVGVAPPSFVLFTNQPAGVKQSYLRYLVRRLRKSYGFAGTPLRFWIRLRKRDSAE